MGEEGKKNKGKERKGEGGLQGSVLVSFIYNAEELAVYFEVATCP